MSEQNRGLRNEILQGDCRELVKTLPSDSIDCVITSPPYLWLRDYGVQGQIGLEKSMQEYLETMWGLFDEIKRVLKPTGTVWVNLGDTYSGMKVGNTNNNMKEGISEMQLVKPKTKIPDKSLMLIPQRFQIGMVDRGWICRNTLIWWKRNAMPSSTKDRFTVDYEFLFFFTKNQKYYFETQYEPYSPVTMKEVEKAVNYSGANLKDYEASGVQVAGDVKRRTALSIAKKMAKFGGNKAEGYGNPTYSGKEWNPQTFGRLKRTVWDIPTKPFSDAHFATYPEELVSNCIKAGCPQFVCTKCGKAYSSLGSVLAPVTNTNGNDQLPAMWSGDTSLRSIPQRKKATLLQQEMFNKVGGDAETQQDTEFQGLHAVMDGGQVCSGAQSSNGAEIRQETREVGDSTPHKRDQDGQQTGKSNSSNRTSTQYIIETKTENNSALSTMQNNTTYQSPKQDACPNCGSTERKPGIILDCFFGSGTTGVAAMKLGRDWLGCELNPEYIEIAKKRLAPLMQQSRLL